jgi:hypothetical protein
MAGLSRFILSDGLSIMLERGNIEDLSTFMASAVVTIAVCRGIEESGVVSCAEGGALE